MDVCATPRFGVIQMKGFVLENARIRRYSVARTWRRRVEPLQTLTEAIH